MNKDPYKILGVNKDSSFKEIQEAYRNLSKQYHPDRAQNTTESIRKLAKEKFIEINNAYNFLKKKKKAQINYYEKKYSEKTYKKKDKKKYKKNVYHENYSYKAENINIYRKNFEENLQKIYIAIENKNLKLAKKLAVIISVTYPRNAEIWEILSKIYYGMTKKLENKEKIEKLKFSSSFIKRSIKFKPSIIKNKFQEKIISEIIKNKKIPTPKKNKKVKIYVSIILTIIILFIFSLLLRNPLSNRYMQNGHKARLNGKLELAIKHYNVSLFLNKNNFETLFYLAKTYERQGEYVLSREYLLKAIDANPDNQEIREYLKNFAKRHPSLQNY